MNIYLLYQTLENYTSTNGNQDLSATFCYANSVIPYVSICVLFPLFMIVLLSTFFGVKRATGRGDFAASLVSAGFITVIGATILSLTKCAGTNYSLVSSGTLITCIAIFIVSVIILFMTRE